MKRIAKFHKVSRRQFVLDGAEPLREMTDKTGETETTETAYDAVRLPCRATAGSAGYDFFLPFSIVLRPGETVKIPTGVRAEMEPGWVLSLYPRSGLGFKYRLQMNNTVGIIDSDYFYSDNEGHIMVKLFNDGREGKNVELKAGTAFAQGIFTEYGITADDDVKDVRNGGFGSTDGRKKDE